VGGQRKGEDGVPGFGLIGSRGEGVDQAVGQDGLAIIEMLGEEGQPLVAEHALGEERLDRVTPGR
jgi:hypothetical protein